MNQRKDQPGSGSGKSNQEQRSGGSNQENRNKPTERTPQRPNDGSSDSEKRSAGDQSERNPQSADGGGERQRRSASDSPSPKSPLPRTNTDPDRRMPQYTDVPQRDIEAGPSNPQVE